MRALFLIAAFCALLAFAAASEEKKIVCYFGSWAVYRPGDGKFEIAYIQPNLCTHMVYTFVGISTDGNIRVLDAWQDLPDNWGKDAFGRFNALRAKSPSTKTMIAIGGWNEGSVKYSEVASNPATRAKFVQNVVAFLKKYKFDGFDLDWEYPNQRGGKPSDVQNYVALVRELREAFDKEGFILSAAVAAAEMSASKSYDIPQVSKYLHFINIMAYDLHGAWEKNTGLNAPLYKSSVESGNNAKLNVDSCVQYWLDQGAPPEKLILGTAFYGRSFTLANEKDNGVGAPAPQAGQAGPYTREAGMLGYNEICVKVASGQWTAVFDEEQRVPYAYNGRQWVGYDNVKSIAEKAEYIKKKNLGGAMLWSIETDDFHGKCGEKYPLLKTLNSILRNGVPVPSEELPPVQRTTTPLSPNDNGSNNHDSANDIDEEEPADQPAVPEVPVDSSVCTKEGFVRDQEDCSVFYICQKFNGEYRATRFSCANGLFFDDNLNVCNYPENVEC
ncbi:acidic mammalian chitinase-like [Prorops nasuta]|uniref:acidic mammalian chitinase-like n=1 Tax=Prorops nasuta TaxID=863751 RepID=UPI0034CF727D